MCIVEVSFMVLLYNPCCMWMCVIILEEKSRPHSGSIKWDGNWVENVINVELSIQSSINVMQDKFVAKTDSAPYHNTAASPPVILLHVPLFIPCSPYSPNKSSPIIHIFSSFFNDPTLRIKAEVPS